MLSEGCARCDRETRQALWGDDLSEGPLHALWPVRWQHGAVMGLDCVSWPGKGPLYLAIAATAALNPKYPKPVTTRTTDWCAFFPIPHEQACDVIACARKIRTAISVTANFLLGNAVVSGLWVTIIMAFSTHFSHNSCSFDYGWHSHGSFQNVVRDHADT